MHEHSFVEAILSSVEDKENVQKVVIEVGELAGIEAEHLKEHILEMYDWEVEVSVSKGRISCGCGFEGEPKILERMHDFVVIECPACGDIPMVLKGKDIKILKVVYY
jgi:Zn finger protein HypA/HybF involved in hydrogenase expression